MKKTIQYLSIALMFFTVIWGCKQDAINDYAEEDIIAAQGGVLVTESGITLEIPPGAFENDGVASVGKTGDEPTTIPNPELTVVGDPFTIRLPADTLLAPLTLSFPLPTDTLTVNNGIFLLFNGTSYFPFKYEIIDGKMVVIIDTINWEQVTTKGDISSWIATTIIDLVHIDDESLVGINQAYVISNKVYYDTPTFVNSSSKILLFVHGLIGDPTGWESYINKINMEPNMLFYTDIWTYGYHSGQSIYSIGEDLKESLLKYTQDRNPTIHIVAHSMGGLVARSMIENSNGKNLVHKLITLGTPHKGSSVANVRHIISSVVGGSLRQSEVNSLIHTYYLNIQSVEDLDPSSYFIGKMIELKDPPIPYYTIACKISAELTIFDWYFFSLPHDGLVSVNSAKGVNGAISPSYDVTIPALMAHMNMRTFNHETPQVNAANRELYAQVINYLQLGPLAIKTGPVVGITPTTAGCSGNVITDGGAAVTARGVCWSTSQNPSIANSKTTDGTGLGRYYSNMTGLSPNTIYYIRAYATNPESTVYGEQTTFRTKQEQVTPTVTTGNVTNISTTTATCSYNVTADGGATVSARGVCWSTTEEPDTEDSKTEDGEGTGDFTSILTGLAPDTTYYVRAYATNAKGTDYGEQKSFTTLIGSLSRYGSFTDFRDGKPYKTVTIGEQTWMAENLAYLPLVLYQGTPSVTDPYYYVYGYSGYDGYTAKATDNYNTYGVLYNFPAALTGCPAGWHLPSDAEWTELETFLANNGYNYDGSTGISGDEALIMKIAKSLASESGWNPSGVIGAVGNTDHRAYRNKSGFSALPGGYKNYTMSFEYVGDMGFWWSSTEDSTKDAWKRSLHKGMAEVMRSSYNKGNGFSVRCLRNNTILTVTTGQVVNITKTTASCSGSVTSDGDQNVTSRGVCWSTSQNPTTENSKTTDGTGVGTFTSNLSGLSPNTPYYVRAYATNSAGTDYGEQKQFTTLSNAPIEFGSFIDSRDFNLYRTVTIGNQTWMAENLAYLPSVVGPATGSKTEPYYYVYGYDGTDVVAAKATENFKTYGALYNWPAAMAEKASSDVNPSGVQGVCPVGWHLPSDAEWTQLENYLADNRYNYDGSIGGGREKIAKSMASKSGWNSSPEPGAVGTIDYPEYRNKSGFSALPGGSRKADGSFTNIGKTGDWWSTSPSVAIGGAIGRFLYFSFSSVSEFANDMAGNSVRCLRD
ncbi:MAG: FISUMP domain-containing protein [Bacteroidales bacterium]|nr:FISUMP domain-containing protein [Bacteroidales bacterium]